jgi:hypothetical protein
LQIDQAIGAEGGVHVAGRQQSALLESVDVRNERVGSRHKRLLLAASAAG